jgi:hypothetical protein
MVVRLTQKGSSSMPSRPAFRTDDRADRDLASDGVSRYGAYLARHRHLFHRDGDEAPPTRDPVQYALAAWTIACPPIMAPGYVSSHLRIQDVTVHWDDEHRAALAVHIAAPAPAVTATLCSPWQDWAREHWPGRWFDPYDNDRVTVLTTLTVRVPLDPHRLPDPRYRSGIPDTDTAKQTVASLCAALNTDLTGLLAALDTPARWMSGLRPP